MRRKERGKKKDTKIIHEQEKEKKHISHTHTVIVSDRERIS